MLKSITLIAILKKKLPGRVLSHHVFVIKIIFIDPKSAPLQAFSLLYERLLLDPKIYSHPLCPF